MNKTTILTIAMLFGVVIAAIIPTNGQAIWYGQYLALSLFLFIWTGVSLWKFNKVLSILLCYCITTTFVRINFISPRAIVLLLQFSLGALASQQISLLNKKNREKIFYAIIILVIIQFGWLCLQVFNKDPIFNSIFIAGKDELVGLSGSKDQLGTFFALTLPIIAFFNLPLCIISFLGIMASKSSFAFMSALISGMTFLWFTKRKLFFKALAICLVAGTIFFIKSEKLNNADFRVRGKVWYYASQFVATGKIAPETTWNGKKTLLTCNPLLGYGFGRFLTIFPRIPQFDEINCATEKFTHAHNDFIEWFFELGFIGIGIIALLIGQFFREFIKAKKSPELILYFCCILTYLFNSTGNFLSQIAVSGMLLIVFYGLYRATYKELNGPNS